MSQPELLKQVVSRLDRIGIEYMLTGSVVSSLQGEPRATHDIDVVIAIHGPAAGAAGALKAAFPEPEFYLDERAMFSLIELRVYEVQHGRLDQSLLDTWAARLGVTELLARLRAEAVPIE